MKRYISKVTISNFQSHADSVIEFGPGLNILCGESDEGKSAAIRLIEWVLFNVAPDDVYITHGEKEAYGEVEFNDHLIIRRLRNPSKAINRYTLYYPTGEEVILNNFGATVPQEVLEAHGMLLDTNIAKQLDGPFMLSKGPTERARLIGEISQTEVLDLSIADTNTDIRNQKANLERAKTEAEALKESLEQYKDLGVREEVQEDIEGLLAALKERIRIFDSIELTVDKMKSSKLFLAVAIKEIDTYADADEILEATNNLVERLGTYMLVHSLAAKIGSDTDRLASLKIAEGLIPDVDAMIEELSNLQGRLSFHKSTSNKMETLAALRTKRDISQKTIDELGDIEGIFDGIEECQNKLFNWSKAKTIEASIQAGKIRVSKGKAVIATIIKELSESADEYVALVKELGKCPTCFSSIGNEVSDHIRSELL